LNSLLKTYLELRIGVCHELLLLLCSAVSVNYRLHAGAGVFVEAPGAGEDDQSDLRVAEDGELPCLLEDPVPPFGERHLPARGVVNPADDYLAPPHPQALADLAGTQG
jgi:hypothetical protein